jgi:hypothetical protein
MKAICRDRSMFRRSMPLANRESDESDDIGEASQSLAKANRGKGLDRESRRENGA